MAKKTVPVRPAPMIAIVPVGVVVLALVLTLPGYSKDIQLARERQKSYRSKVIDTACGPIEYAESGEGEPVLFVHGVVGGYDQGILTGQIIIGEGFRIIAPSRFGYQNTPMPADASPAAQADAHACLLDALNLSKVAVLGVSAGAPSSVQFALRHPDRVTKLVLFVPLAYHPEPEASQSITFPFILSSLLKVDFPIWAAMKLNPTMVLSVMGIPPEIQKTLTKEQQVETMNMLLPFDTRIPGVMNDGKIAANMEPFPLQEVTAPTLAISAKDDLWKTYPSAEYTANQIPGARFIGFETGGHMLNGQEENVRSEITTFLRQKP